MISYIVESITIFSEVDISDAGVVRRVIDKRVYHSSPLAMPYPDGERLERVTKKLYKKGGIYDEND